MINATFVYITSTFMKIVFKTKNIVKNSVVALHFAYLFSSVQLNRKKVNSQMCFFIQSVAICCFG